MEFFLISGISLGIGIMMMYSPLLEISENDEIEYIKSIDCPPTDNHLYIPQGDLSCGIGTGYKMILASHTLSQISLIIGSFFGVFGIVILTRSYYQNKNSVIK